MPTSAIRLRNLTPAEVPFAMGLKSAAGWNQTEADWRRFLELEPQGCFVAEYKGQPAGTVTALSYGERVGWIGMMLVDPERRRLGIASALLEHAVRYLEGRGVETAKLDATPMGKKVYDQHGFRDEYRIERRVSVSEDSGVWRENVRAGHGKSCVPILPRDLDRIAEFDAEIFGADRGRLLATLLRDAPGLCFQTEGGFVMARCGTNATQIGPWVAVDAAAAERLLACVLGRLGGVAALIDVPLCNEAADALSARAGFQMQRELIRQYRGPNRFTGEMGCIYGITGPELG